MNNYAEYKAEDFAIDPDFIQWVLEKKQADDEFWRQWLQVNPQKKEIIEEARNILLSLKIKEKTIGPESLNREIEAIILKVKKRSSKGIVPMLFRWKYAAMLAGLVLGAYMVYDAISSSRNDQGTTGRGMPSLSTGMAEVSNTSSQVSSVSLPDGSHVRLFPGAIIRYSHHLASNETRDLYLSGEAFFEVAKDSGKPFRVFSHELVTRVLGTSFTIKANEKEKQISVMVRTGIVSVYNKDKENNKKDTGLKKLAGVVLTANQQLVYAREQHQFQKSLIEQPLLIHPAEIKIISSMKMFLLRMCLNN
ncbi:MAG: FecR domain-containing protein [Bacteroidia bacterium]|nr:FecR domain-containing protein [Bacteroidia bacterium]